MHRHYEGHKVTQRVHTQQTNRNIKHKCVLIERSVKRDGRNEKSDFSAKCGTKWSPVNACGVYQVADDSKFAYQPPLEESAVTREEVFSNQEMNGSSICRLLGLFVRQWMAPASVSC